MRERLREKELGLQFGTLKNPQTMWDGSCRVYEGSRSRQKQRRPHQEHDLSCPWPGCQLCLPHSVLRDAWNIKCLSFVNLINMPSNLTSRFPTENVCSSNVPFMHVALPLHEWLPISLGVWADCHFSARRME